LAPGFAESFALERAGSDAAVEAGEPGFADGFEEIGFVGEKRGQRMGAPDSVGEHGVDAEGFGFHLMFKDAIDGGELARKSAESSGDSMRGLRWGCGCLNNPEGAEKRGPSDREALDAKDSGFMGTVAIDG